MEYFLQGFTMGLAYVAPIGLQNLFVINAALTQSRKKALLTALIVIFFDVTLAFACFFGIGAIMQNLKWLQMIVLLVGSIIVIYIGINLLRSKEVDIDNSKSEVSIGKTISSACVVTWFNPQAIVDGTMMLGAFRVALPAEHSIRFITGVTSASFTWFICLSMLISIFSNKFNSKILRIINLICGAIIIFYGIKLLWSFITMII